jgi:2-iminoacetate synthase ThiH
MTILELHESEQREAVIAAVHAHTEKRRAELHCPPDIDIDLWLRILSGANKLSENQTATTD